MKLLARADHLVLATIWAESLRAAGIRCQLRNISLSGAIGEIPFLECAPQLWIERDADEPRAREILQELRRPSQGPAWRCADCGETSEPQFGACWQCGAARPA
jgi:Putative prokaryotic signal transducing protein